MLKGAPAALLSFFCTRPGSTIDDAIAALKLNRSTAQSALGRLRSLSLLELLPGGRDRHWKAAMPRSMVATRKAGSAPARHLPPLQATGVPIERAGRIQVFAVSGPRRKEAQYSHAGSVNAPGATHPWAWGNWDREE